MIGHKVRYEELLITIIKAGREGKNTQQQPRLSYINQIIRELQSKIRRDGTTWCLKKLIDNQDRET